MIGLDTNVLVRLVVEDDPRQAEAARRLVTETVAAGERCFLGDVVLCELEWVLESCYGASRQEILATVQGLLAAPAFDFEDRAKLLRALDLYGRGRGDLSDHLLGAEAEQRGARTTFTFDRALRDAAPFTLLG